MLETALLKTLQNINLRTISGDVKMSGVNAIEDEGEKLPIKTQKC